MIKFASNFSNVLRIQTLSPLFLCRISFFKQRVNLNGGVGPAVLRYHNVYESRFDSATLIGYSPGILGTATLEYALNKNLNIGISSSYTNAFLKEVTKISVAGEESITLEENNYLKNISRLDLAIILRLKFNLKRGF
jgi:hypothetical protein